MYPFFLNQHAASDRSYRTLIQHTGVSKGKIGELQVCHVDFSSFLPLKSYIQTVP